MLESVRDGLRALVYAVRRLLWALLARVTKSERLWDLIEGTGIVVFTGPNGSGKSLAAVNSVLRTLNGDYGWVCDELAHYHNEVARVHWQECHSAGAGCASVVGAWVKNGKGKKVFHGRVGLCETACDLLDESNHGERLVYSTVTLLDPDGGVHDRYRPLVDFRQLVTIEHADLLFDEVAGIADSSDSSAIPVQVTNWLHQLRKRDCRLRVTTPAYSRCAKPIRQAAQLVVDARAYFPELGSSGRLWRSRQAMIFRAFDAFDFADFTPHAGKTLKPLGRAAFWRPDSLASHSYSTLASVSALGHVTEGGMCGVCGGGRSRPRCACDHSVDEVPMHLLHVEEKVSASGARTRQAVVKGAVPVQARKSLLTAVDGDN